jgi:prevent-host-death family protein
MVMNGFTKTTFKAHALEHMRNVQTTKRPLVILDRGKPVLKVIPYAENMEDELLKFRGLLLKYDNPTASVGTDDWRLVE